MPHTPLVSQGLLHWPCTHCSVKPHSLSDWHQAAQQHTAYQSIWNSKSKSLCLKAGIYKNLKQKTNFFLIMELLVRTYVCKSAGSSKCFEDSRCWRRSWQESDDSRVCNRWVCPRSQAHTDTHLYDRQQHTLRWAHIPLPRKHLHRVWSLEFAIPNKSCAADNCLDIMYIFYLTIASIIYEIKIYLYLALYYSSQSLFRP